MSRTTTETCSLCHQGVLPSEVLPFPRTDDLDARERVLELIARANPEWVAEDGACARSGEEYGRL